MSNIINLTDIRLIENPNDYLVHFGRKEPGGTQPLDTWVQDPENWKNWQRHYVKRNPFSRKFIFSLMNFDTDIWLFGGIFEVTRQPEDNDGQYEVELKNLGKPFIGRLKLHLEYKDRTPRVKLEKYYSKFEVVKILRKPYSG